MKHIQTISKAPARAADIPVSEIIAFIVAILTAISTLISVKEATS